MHLINGSERGSVSADDRGLMYGDGVFRTFLLVAGKPQMWQLQYAKLAADCAVLRIGCPEKALFEADLAAVAGRYPDCVVRIVVTRGSGPRGYAIPEYTIPTRVVSAGPLPVYPPGRYTDGVRVHLCRTRLALQPALAGVKHLNRLENVLARSEWRDPAVAEGLMCDSEDNVICGTMSNLFLVEGGQLVTPRLTRCGVTGVQRQSILDLAQKNGVEKRTGDVSIDRLFAADELFLVNSVIGVWQVAALERRRWEKGTVTTQVRAWLAAVHEHF